jgi:hypothetical protein
MARLKDYSSFDDSLEVMAIEEIEGQEVSIEGAQFTEGKYGEYAFMAVTLEDGSKVKVMTGARFILEALHKAEDEKAFPVDASFVKKGRAWLFE